MKKKKPNKVAWAYLAGIIDGEGCICCSKRKPANTAVQYCLIVTIVNTDFRLMEWLRENFGGSISKVECKAPYKDKYRWYARSEDVTSLLTATMPYLVLKREQARLAISYRETVKGLGQKITASNHHLRSQIVKQLKALNRRGS